MTGFIGAGNMATAMISGLVSSGTLKGKDLAVFDICNEKSKKLSEKFGLNVVYYRKRKKLTQLQLAELVDIDRSHISAIELGNVGVSFDVVFKLCEVLEISPKDLFDFRD